VAGAALFLFDFSLTFSDELQYLWRSRKKLTLSTTLYIAARYPALASVVISFLPTTVFLRNVDTCLKVVAICSSEFIFGVRTWALYEKSKTMAVVLVLGAIAALAPGIVVVVKDVTTTRAQGQTEFADFPQCQIFISAAKNEWLLPYAVTIAFEILNLSLSIPKIAKWRKHLPKASRSSLLDTIRNDGIIYFCFMLLLGFMNIGLVLQVSNPQLRSGGTQLQTCLHSMLSCRMILHVANSEWRAEELPTTATSELEELPEDFTVVSLAEDYSERMTGNYGRDSKYSEDSVWMV